MIPIGTYESVVMENESEPNTNAIGISDADLDSLDAKGRVEIQIAMLLREFSPMDRLRIMRSVAAQMGCQLPAVPELLDD